MLACDAVVPKRRIVAPTGKAVTLAPIHPNLGIEAAYRKRLDALLDEMQASLVYWLKAGYRSNEPEMMAEDISPAAAMRGIFRRLARRWQRHFDTLAPELAAYFATAVKDRSDFALKVALKKGGMTVEFKLSPAMNDVLQATIGQNVALIKSISSEHLSAVEGAVMRSVQAGRDLGPLAKELETRYGVTKRRAALIARSQNNLATASVTRVRQLELGITEAIWVHSAGGKHPRESHIKAGRDKMKYDVSKGALIDGEYIFPGQLLGCRCVSKSFIPGFE
jgi:Phage Mu protein F like protein